MEIKLVVSEEQRNVFNKHLGPNLLNEWLETTETTYKTLRDYTDNVWSIMRILSTKGYAVELLCQYDAIDGDSNTLDLSNIGLRHRYD